MQSLVRFAQGPLRTNLLVTKEVFKIVAREQQLLPSLHSWPQARQAYADAFESVKRNVQLFGISESVMRGLRDATWGQVGRVLRDLLQLGSFYYIGQLLGQVSGYLIN